MFYENEPKFVSVIVRGKKIWLDGSTFDQMASYRSDRIKNGERYNDGRVICDQFADDGIELVPGGEATIRELQVFAKSRYEMTSIFGNKWFEYLPSEFRPA